MTATINEDCSEVLIVSGYAAGDNTSVLLTVTYNCTTTYTEITIPVGDESYTLTPTSLDLDTDALADGIYGLTIVTTQASANVITEQKCIFINCSTTCDLSTVFTDAVGGDEDAFTRMLAYQALLMATECIDCTCANMCTLYSAAVDETCIPDAQPCGCS